MTVKNNGVGVNMAVVVWPDLSMFVQPARKRLDMGAWPLLMCFFIFGCCRSLG